MVCAVLGGCADTGGGPPQRPTAFPSSDTEFQTLLHECMEAEGWPSEIQDNGVYRYSYSDAQKDAFDAANSGCIDAIGGNLPVVRSDEEWRDLYDFYVVSVECLREHDIEADDPPSFSVWEESDHTWSPYAAVNPNDLTQEQFEALTQDCPQTPE